MKKCKILRTRGKAGYGRECATAPLWGGAQQALMPRCVVQCPSTIKHTHSHKVMQPHIQQPASGHRSMGRTDPQRHCSTPTATQNTPQMRRSSYTPKIKVWGPDGNICSWMGKSRIHYWVRVCPVEWVCCRVCRVSECWVSVEHGRSRVSSLVSS